MGAPLTSDEINQLLDASQQRIEGLLGELGRAIENVRVHTLRVEIQQDRLAELLRRQFIRIVAEETVEMQEAAASDASGAPR